MKKKKDPIAIKEFDFYPKNEGEVATYRISFVPTNPLNINIRILVIFPQSYDNLLGYAVNCKIVAGVVTDLKCSVSNAIITISGIDYYNPEVSNPLIIEFYGINNPNRIYHASVGALKMATIAKNSVEYIDYNENVAIYSMEKAPDWSIVHKITAGNYFSRFSIF